MVEHDRLPPRVRPAREDLEAFSKLFPTDLLNTLDLDANPGERPYSPDAHCFCHLCSWMVRAPHLRPKEVGAADHAVADRMKRRTLGALAANTAAGARGEVVETLLATGELREAIGLFTYAHDLLERLQGVAVGPASLALWRSFAWTPEGSPKKGFTLSANEIMGAREALSRRLSESRALSSA